MQENIEDLFPYIYILIYDILIYYYMYDGILTGGPHFSIYIHKLDSAIKLY